MILQALTQYYDALNARGEIDAPGWGRPKISYALQLRENGELAQVIPLLHEVDAGKKKVLRPREDIRLPAANETSIVMAVRPELVDFGQVKDDESNLIGIAGRHPVKESSEAFGNELLEYTIKTLAAGIEEEYKAIKER